MGGFKTAQEYQAVISHLIHAAATATEKRCIFVAPCKCRVTGVEFGSDVAATGDNTNTTNLNVLNGGSDGSGTTEVGNLDLVTGVDIVAFDRKNIPLNATYANGVDLNEGDVLLLQYEKVATGLAVTLNLIQVDWIPV